jgi:hypothetical protein
VLTKRRITTLDRKYLDSQLDVSEVTPEIASQNVFVFARYFLGVTPFQWQGVFLRAMQEERLLAAVTPRQCGKTLAISIDALWNAVYNKKPTGKGVTTICIVSATEEQAKKVLADIIDLVYKGDYEVEMLTKGKVKKYFSSQIATKGKSKSHLKFRDGSQIICLPATDAVRGYSFSKVYVDEAAFLENPNFLSEKIEPTVAFTKGSIILTSTPAGIGGPFYTLFDPEDKRRQHRYYRLWFGKESMVEPELQRDLQLLKEEAIAGGKLNAYYQEYEAEFTSSVDLFLSPSKIESMTTEDLRLHPLESFYDVGLDETISIGVDFGMSVSKTVITVVSYSDSDGAVRLLNQFVYEYGTDAFVVDDIVKLYHRYRADFLVIDYCPESYFAAEQMRSRGLALFEFRFGSMKVSAYNSLRQWINKGSILIPNDGTADLRLELSSLRERKTNLTTKIEKPQGGSDDRADSLLLACYPFFEYSEAARTAVGAFYV